MKNIILASVSMGLGQRVLSEAIGIEMWKSLEDFFEEEVVAHKQNMRPPSIKKSNVMDCKQNRDVVQHIEDIFFINLQLAALSATFRESISRNGTSWRFYRLRVVAVFETQWFYQVFS